MVFSITSFLESDNLQQIRQKIFAAVDFCQNVSHRQEGKTSSSSNQIPSFLDSNKDLTTQFTEWLQPDSPHLAYIPPEVVVELPAATACHRNKVISWIMGCWLLQLLNPLKSLEIIRQRRNGDLQRFQCKNPDFLLQELQTFYAGAGNEPDLYVGPEIEVIQYLPLAFKEFLGRCLQVDVGKRATLANLVQLHFLDMRKSIAELFALDTAHYQKLLPTEERFSVKNLRDHPFWRRYSHMITVHLGDIHFSNANATTSAQPPWKTVELWQFSLDGSTNEKLRNDRELFAKAYGKLLLVTALNDSTEVHSKTRASFHGIRALQKKSTNVLHHFGCQFTSPKGVALPEFQLFVEHCQGKNFDQAASFFIPVDILEKWVTSVLRGLEYIHGHGIIHRNLNSRIILFTGPPDFQGTIKIGGFQNMRQLEGELTAIGELSKRQGEDGRFAAPELVNNYEGNPNVGRLSDIWSLGCIVLHLASGKPPLYEGRQNKEIKLEMAVLYHLNGDKRKLPEIYDWIPSGVKAFILQCLQFDPQLRQTAAALLDGSNGKLFGNSSGDHNYQQGRGAPVLPLGVVQYWENTSV
ncbi:uncharacterized protein LOC129602472 [Paramacrobiotus metropolitanus]|uniref:uncharacterized protein LOC129602472 n=1 Tax=Paramacrobiotus metropolitanus TaxID=2943436 RepID=UPI002445DE27|nr:uncharacterized protein LOC129602472 [Paramacrobiotus metropolitanus]